MKTSIVFGAALAIVGVAATPVIAQAQTSTTTITSGYVQTSKLVGTKVKTGQGEEVGVIKDVVLDRNTGCMAYTVLSTSGVGTRAVGHAKTVAVPWAVYTPTSDLSVLTVRIDRDRIYNAPVFDHARIDEYTSTGYINNIYSYYGVPAQVGVAGQTSVTGGATTTTATTASPMATASPTATAARVTGTASPAATASPTTTASPAARASASPHATASATPSGATASPSKRETRGARGRTGATPSPSGPSETASPTGTESSSAEGAGSPSERKKSQRRHGKEAPSESKPSATPEKPQEQE